MREAIETRISRRRYLPTPIDEERLSKIRAEIEALNRESGLTMEYVPDAAEAFSSMRKTYGMFSGVRAVVVMKGPERLPNLAESIGYYGERLVLALTDMGLGTCWVGGTFDRKKFAVPAGEKMLCVIPFGVVEEQSGKEKFIRRNVSRKRKPASERMSGYEDAPDWVKSAMEAVRLAPSAVNSQKPAFKYENGVVTATVKVVISMDLIDLGIAKLHFAEAAGGYFELGKNGRFVKSE